MKNILVMSDCLGSVLTITHGKKNSLTAKELGGYNGYYGIRYTLSLSADDLTIAIGLEKVGVDATVVCHAFA